jgi:hypothetical protein
MQQSHHPLAQEIIARGPSDFHYSHSLGFGHLGYLFLMKNVSYMPWGSIWRTGF